MTTNEQAWERVKRWCQDAKSVELIWQQDGERWWVVGMQQENLGVTLQRGDQVRCLSALNVVECFTVAPAKPALNAEKRSRWALLMMLYDAGLRELIRRDGSNGWRLEPHGTPEALRIRAPNGGLERPSIDDVFVRYIPSSRALCEIPRDEWGPLAPSVEAGDPASHFAREVRATWDWEAASVLTAGNTAWHVEGGAWTVEELREEEREVKLRAPRADTGTWFSAWQVPQLFRAISGQSDEERCTRAGVQTMPGTTTTGRPSASQTGGVGTMNCEACAKYEDSLMIQATGVVAIAGAEHRMCGHHRMVLPVDAWPACPDGWSFDELRGMAGCWIAPGVHRHVPGNAERQCPQTEKLTREAGEALGMRLWSDKEAP